MYGDAIGAGPAAGTFDLWLPPDAVIAAMANEGDPIPTGFAPLDRQFRRGGITPGRIVTIGGEPYSGKTTVIAAIALHVSQKIPVFALFSDEGRSQAAIRMGVMLGVPLSDLEDRPALAAPRVAEAMGERTLHLLKPDTEDSHAEAVVAYAREKTPPGMPALIVLDSVQTIPRSGEVDEDERLGIKAFMKACRKWAPENRFVFLLASQANRESYKYRAGAKNTRKMASFSGSAAIEFMSDVALVVGERNEQKVAPVEIVKNRLGSVESFSIRYDDESGRMLEVDGPAAEDEKTRMADRKHENTVSKIADAVEAQVRKRGRLTVRQIGELVGGKHSNVSEAIRGLEARGVLEPEPGPRGALIWRIKA